MRPGRHPSRGFTLIELVIVTVITGILAAMLAPLALASLRAYDDILGDVVVLDKLRYATERLAREIREVYYASNTTTTPRDCGESTPTTNRYCISAMEANSLTFRTCTAFTLKTTTPTDRHCSDWRTVTIGTTGSTGSAVTLAYSDAAGNAAQVLTDELGAASNLAFAYYQQNGNTAVPDGNVNCMSVVTCVSYVEISLTLRHNNNDYTQRTRVGLRNQ